MSPPTESDDAFDLRDEANWHRLPTEIHNLVLRQLPNSSLAICARLSTYLHQISTPILYKELTVDFSRQHHPFSLLHIEEVSKAGMEKPVASEPNPSGRARYPPPSYNRFEHTTHLTVVSHPYAICKHYPPPPMPSLMTMHLQYETDFCTYPYVDDGGFGPTPPRQYCPIMDSLRPPQVSLGDANTQLKHFPKGLYGNFPSRFPPPWLEDVVVFIYDNQTICSRLFFAESRDYKPSGKLKRVTLVMRPSNEIWLPRPSSEASKGDAGELLDCLARIASGSAKVVEIVGLDTIDPVWLGKPLEDFISGIKERITLWMCLFLGRKYEDVERRFEDLDFLTHGDYDKRKRLRSAGQGGQV